MTSANWNEKLQQGGKISKAGNGQVAQRPKGISIANWISVGKSSDDGGVAHT